RPSDLGTLTHRPVVLRPAPPRTQRLLTSRIRRVELVLPDLVRLTHVRMGTVSPQVEPQATDANVERLVRRLTHSPGSRSSQARRYRLGDVRACALLNCHGTSLGCFDPGAARAALDRRRDDPLAIHPHVQGLRHPRAIETHPDTLRSRQRLHRRPRPVTDRGHGPHPEV